MGYAEFQKARLKQQATAVPWSPPSNNPFTPEGWLVVQDNWADVGIDVSNVPPIGVQLTPPYPDQPPEIEGSGGGTYPTTPPPVTPEEDNIVNGNGESGGFGAMGAIAGIAMLAIILGGFK